MVMDVADLAGEVLRQHATDAAIGAGGDRDAHRDGLLGGASMEPAERRLARLLIGCAEILPFGIIILYYLGIF